MSGPDDVLGRCTSEMRAALYRLRRGPRFLGSEPPNVPRSTAHALRRRGLIENESGSRVRLTDLGRDVALLAFRARLRAIPPADGEIRMTAIVYARRDERYGPDCLVGSLGETVTLKKDMGGSYTGRLIDYDVIEDGEALRLTLDVPTPFEYLATTRLSIEPATP